MERALCNGGENFEFGNSRLVIQTLKTECGLYRLPLEIPFTLFKTSSVQLLRKKLCVKHFLAFPQLSQKICINETVYRAYFLLVHYIQSCKYIWVLIELKLAFSLRC